LRHIHFALRPEAEAQALDAYLSALLPEPSPWRSDPAFRAAAARGRQLFDSPEVGCARCHPAPRYTDLKAYAVGTLQTPAGHPAALDTPTLIEVWRTAPYLHDGSAATVQEVLTVRNPGDQHGRTSHLAPDQLADLCAFVLSL
jgi:cytochrome c peroxidase